MERKLGGVAWTPCRVQGRFGTDADQDRNLIELMFESGATAEIRVGEGSGY